ncbi:MAG: hypothetical protein H7841_16415, partial [Magnetospirillum sp. WYHS-4]
ADAFERTAAGPAHPPGYYGEGATRRAFNLAVGTPEPMADLPGDVAETGYGLAPATDLRPWFLGAALLLFLVDLAATLVLRGRVAAAVALALLALGGTGRADDAFALAATAELRLAYVKTGDAALDASAGPACSAWA